MTPEIWILFTHLAGVQCCGTDHVKHPTEQACKEAGRRWLATIKHRSANDWAECFKRKP